MDNKFYENIKKCLGTEWEETIDESYGNMWSPSDSSVANAIEELVNAPKTQDTLDKAKLVAEYVDKHLKYNLSVIEIDERVFAGKVILDDLITKLSAEVSKEKKNNKKTMIFGIGFIVVLGLLILGFALGSGKIDTHKYTGVNIVGESTVYDDTTQKIQGHLDICNDTKYDINGVKLVVDLNGKQGESKFGIVNYDVKIKSGETKRIYIDKKTSINVDEYSIWVSEAY